MFYRELAERFNELSVLSDLVNKLLSTDKPLKELKIKNFISNEFDRIKSATHKALIVFGNESEKYYYFHLSSLYSLIITVNEKTRELLDKLYRNEREEYQLRYFDELLQWLRKLIQFYTDIDLSMIK